MERLTFKCKDRAYPIKEMRCMGLNNNFNQNLEEIINKLADYEDREELKGKQKEDLQKILDHYGQEAQERQLFEEMGELIDAINKLWRINNGYKDANLSESFQAVEDVYGELADVSIMIEQMIERFDCREEVENIRQEKIERQLKRIEGDVNVS